MNTAKIIGIGAAGNKGAIQAIKDNVIDRTNVILLNSTFKDIPAEYKDIATEFSGDIKGCGKEPELAKKIALQSLQNQTINLDGLLDPTDKMVIIVTSSEGGTGCGAARIIAKYMKEVLKVNVLMFIFTGFETDGRGMKNTADLFSEMSPAYTIQSISNKKFLKENGNNEIKAQDAANKEFSQRIRILLGQDLIESDENIDETDLTKLTTEPGFMSIEYGELDKPKNTEAYNKMVSDIIDNSKSLDFTPTAKRIGVILNISEKTKAAVDFSHTVIKDKFGKAFEIYKHIQSEHEPEYIAIIAAGMKMPIDEVKAVYERYKEALGNVDVSKDDFFNMKFDTKEASIFDMENATQDQTRLIKDKSNFFAGLSVEQTDEQKADPAGFKNTKKNLENL